MAQVKSSISNLAFTNKNVRESILKLIELGFQYSAIEEELRALTEDDIRSWINAADKLEFNKRGERLTAKQIKKLTKTQQALISFVNEILEARKKYILRIGALELKVLPGQQVGHKSIPFGGDNNRINELYDRIAKVEQEHKVSIKINPKYDV